MTQDKAPKEPKKGKGSKDKDFTEAVKIMANTAPISNDEIIKRNKKNKK
ncbi:MAG TPA: hypothetical protein VMR45_01245 [Patescibacteria group bacterium]|nr:hypothetical protein [Patescibacteria group bacterium]